MALFRALTIQNGITTQLQAGSILAVGDGIDTDTTTTLTIGGNATSVNILPNTSFTGSVTINTGLTVNSLSGFGSVIIQSDNLGNLSELTKTFSGDLSGIYPSATVIKLQGVPVSSTAPTDGYVLTYVSSGSNWAPVISTAAIGPLTPPLNGSWSQATWYIDPQNSLGTSSDINNGLTSGTALRTFRELTRRWGTVSPILTQNTTINFVSSHTDNSDPVALSPYMVACYLIIQGAIGVSQQVATGTLSGTISKNRSTGTLLQSTLSPGLTAGQLVSVTHGGNTSRCWTYANAGGNAWKLSQPLKFQTTPIPSSAFPPVEDDTFIDGYTYTVYNPVSVNIVEVSPRCIDLDVSFDPIVQISSLVIPDYNFGVLLLSGDLCVWFFDVRINKEVSIAGTAASLVGVFSNVYMGSRYEGQTEGTISVVGGTAAGFGNFGTMDADVIISNNITGYSSGTIGLAYIESGKIVDLQAGSIGTVRISSSYAGGAVIYGPGNINVFGCTRVSYNGTATNIFKLTGTIKINSSTTAYSIAGTNPATIYGGIPITPANLDATAGNAGFGGLAFLPGGGSITNGAL